MDTNLLWAITLVGGALVGEAAWAELRDSQSRRRVVKRGRALTLKYGLPWR